MRRLELRRKKKWYGDFKDSLTEFSYLILNRIAGNAHGSSKTLTRRNSAPGAIPISM